MNYMTDKNAIIVCSPDAFANAIKPRELKIFLEKRGYTVELFSTNNLSRLGKGMARFFPGIGLNKLLLYSLEVIHLFAHVQKNRKLRKTLVSRITLPMMKLHTAILHSTLANRQNNLLICESNMDIGIVSYRHATIQILDLPSPFAEELYYGNTIGRVHYNQLKEYESAVYAKADYLSFHWHTYTDFVKREKYNGDNFINLGYGTTPKTAHAKYSEHPKIVFLGLLSGYWVNLPLLEKLTRQYPFIDVYGGPPIPNAKINYKGYAPSLEVLAQYQFGLITISDDKLRRSSFSSKQLEYFSYGLPVLTPDWRKDDVLEDGSIYFNEKNFLFLIKQFSNKQRWGEKSSRAIKISHDLMWENVLQPLDMVI